MTKPVSASLVTDQACNPGSLDLVDKVKARVIEGQGFANPILQVEMMIVLCFHLHIDLF